MKKLLLTCLLAAALAGPGLAPAARAASIGVSLTNGTNGTFLAATDSAGVAPYAQTNYNNTSGGGAGVILRDNTGINTTTLFTLSGTAGFLQYANPVSGADEVLNGKCLYSSNNTALTFSLTNIPYSNYILVVYALYDTPTNPTIRITAAGTTYYINPPVSYLPGYVDNNPATPFTYTRGTSTNAAAPTANADYVLFTGLSGPSLTFTVLNTADIAEVAGFQIIQVPEPSTWAMLGVGAMGLGVVALRRRQAVRG